MAATLDLATLQRIEELIEKSLGAREQYRANPSSKTIAEFWRYLGQALSLFPEGTFKDNVLDPANLNPYESEMIIAQTEAIWAFSNGTQTDDLDCPQRAVDLYSGFAKDLYNFWYYKATGKNAFANLCHTVTNTLTNWSLITQDTRRRQGLQNSPRAGMAAYAFVITNSMIGDWTIRNQTKQLWAERCGTFTVVQD
ncbi:hypothetical protein BGZ61DRAFT_451835 [Ilyonectria robusta]|uniref:uncharacterized protein n=1 Tax=Ilyonectria robusta TaxID=1079257 RepID=UPI001E8DD4AA|nr:uncharacterized protein BGZ61DRAFT_451835 [Ilyonectria robusta]KAH8694347.1 hypothetical protein BGZ61DRAFT_451835 [Ilyonectria robusta]